MTILVEGYYFNSLGYWELEEGYFGQLMHGYRVLCLGDSSHLPLISLIPLINKNHKPIFVLELSYHFWSCVLEVLEHLSCGKKPWGDRAAIRSYFRAKV